jgi:hypothetical protein
VRITIRRRGKLTVNCQSMLSPAISLEAGDDTIELELTSEQLQELSQAAQAAESVAPTLVSAAPAPARISPALFSPQPLFEVSPARRLRPWHQTPIAIAKVAGAVIAYAAFAWWSAVQFAEQPQPPPTAVARPTVVIPPPALIASSSQPAVKLINPFDATEVFEFPAGTSPAERRAKVAQILLQRARERQEQWARSKPAVNPAVNVRTASLYRSP